MATATESAGIEIRFDLAGSISTSFYNSTTWIQPHLQLTFLIFVMRYAHHHLSYYFSPARSDLTKSTTSMLLGTEEACGTNIPWTTAIVRGIRRDRRAQRSVSRSKVRSNEGHRPPNIGQAVRHYQKVDDDDDDDDDGDDSDDDGRRRQW